MSPSDAPYKSWRAVCFQTGKDGNYATFRTPEGQYWVGEIGLGQEPRWIGTFRKGGWSSMSGIRHKGMVYDRRGELRLAAHTVRQMMLVVIQFPDPEAGAKAEAYGRP